MTADGCALCQAGRGPERMLLVVGGTQAACRRSKEDINIGGGRMRLHALTASVGRCQLTQQQLRSFLLDRICCCCCGQSRPCSAGCTIFLRCRLCGGLCCCRCFHASICKQHSCGCAQQLTTRCAGFTPDKRVCLFCRGGKKLTNRIPQSRDHEVILGLHLRNETTPVQYSSVIPSPDTPFSWV